MRILSFVCLLWLLNATTLSAQGGKDVTLQEIWASPIFRPEMVLGISSMNDGIHYSTLKSDDKGLRIEKYNYAGDEKKADILDAGKVKIEGKDLDFGDYHFSADEKMLLVPTESEPIYRYSSKSAFVVIDLEKNKAEYLGEGKQQYAEFSPDGKKVGFVKDNNLFIKDLVSGKITEVTHDGLQNSVINGATDWVYEEEFALSQAFFWSPDGSRLAFLRFDESAVREFMMSTYGSLYPGEYRFKYPKAGEDNSLVNVHVYELTGGKTVKMLTGDDKNQYIPRVKWTADGASLSIVRMNRLQNKLELLLANPADGSVKTLLEEKSETYIDVNDNLTFLNDNKHFIWSSELGGFNHLYLYDMAGKRKNAITSGEMDITDFYGYDEMKGNVYFSAAYPKPSDRTVFACKLNGKGQKVLFETTGGHQQPEFSNNFSYAIVRQSKANEPSSYTLYSGEGKMLRVIESNSRLKSKLNEYSFSQKEFFTFTTSSGVSLNGWMIKPSSFDASKKYPVFMTVYGGPGHNTVENAWEGSNYLWHQMLAQKGYIVVSVDNRGTGNRGEKFKKVTYKQLGKLETEDQIEVARYLAGQSYVDPSRIGIQGWSYGGYMSSLCITKGADFFKMAIAVAPVTNWRYYDSIYTERFMQTPQDNASGYDDNSPINHVSRLKGKYLLIHGTGDDNVHFQNSVEMVNSLVKANKQFDVFFYPDKNHGIYGGNARLHLYTLMTDYILKNL